MNKSLQSEAAALYIHIESRKSSGGKCVLQIGSCNMQERKPLNCGDDHANNMCARMLEPGIECLTRLAEQQVSTQGTGTHASRIVIQTAT
jgi:hypothetical protein